MVRNQNGFYRPVVEPEKCVDCGKCVATCAFGNDDAQSNQTIHAFSAWSANAEIRRNSTSGGVLFELTRHLINNGYDAVGVKYNCENNKAEYFIAYNEESLLDSVGSKYAQAVNFDVFRDIDFDRHHIIISTPCTIASLSKFIPKDKRDNFILVDFFCHGLPSYNLLDKYINHVENKIGYIKRFHFRSKDTGWQDSTTIKAYGTEGEYTSSLSHGDIFFKMFLRDRCLAACCYDSCRFKARHSCADIRVGDFWGTKYSDSTEGINAVFVFNERGMKAIDCCGGLVVNVVAAEDILAGQHSKCPRRAKSYSYVMKNLPTNVPLSRISRNADIIDSIRGGLFSKIKLHLKRIIAKQ